MSTLIPDRFVRKEKLRVSDWFGTTQFLDRLEISSLTSLSFHVGPNDIFVINPRAAICCLFLPRSMATSKLLTAASFTCCANCDGRKSIVLLENLTYTSTLHCSWLPSLTSVRWKTPSSYLGRLKMYMFLWHNGLLRQIARAIACEALKNWVFKSTKKQTRRKSYGLKQCSSTQVVGTHCWLSRAQ